MKKFWLWPMVILAVFINYRLGDQYFLDKIPVIDSIQYGNFLVQKWFLVAVALVFLGYWIFQQKQKLTFVKENVIHFILIVVFTFGAHWFSYFRWFEFDDYRVIGHHYSVVGTAERDSMGLGNSTSYAIGMVYLVVRWFGTNYEWYNTLGLLIYSLSGITIYLFANKIQKNKFIALCAALFFITSSTYWRQTLMMQEFIGDGFGMLLFSLTNLLLVSGFFPGAVIFSAAALEFGLSRLHYIAAPLILITLLLFKVEERRRVGWKLALLSFPIISLLYITLLSAYKPDVIDYVEWSNNWKEFMRLGDSIFSVTVPHVFAFLLIAFTKWLFPSFLYASSLLGGLVVVALLIYSLWLFRCKQFLPAKLIFIGTSVIVGAITFPTLMGIRLIHNIESLSLQYDDLFPTAATSYGLSSTFGMIFVIIGFGLSLKQNLFRKIIIVLLAANVLTLVKSDIEWTNLYSRPQRITDSQIMNIIPADGLVKVVYTPPPTEILSRYIDYFYQLYRIKEPLYFTNDASDFIKLIAKYKPAKDHIYVLTMDVPTYKVTDISQRFRDYSTDKLTLDVVKTMEKSK